MRITTFAVTAFVAISLGACAPAKIKRTPIPERLADTAMLPGMPSDIRVWGDADIPADQYDEIVKRMADNMAGQQLNWLVLSGGGQNGAFGAGILKGWTECGTRPEFDTVTGVSTGALMAPFAFLGSEYDDELEAAYTEYSTKDLIRSRGLLTALMSDAAADTKGLQKMIDKMITQEVVDAIGREYTQNGRGLLVATTNLDAMRSVKWNITKIAASGHPDRLKLIRSVLLASASIPAAFPPVFIDVVADGKAYDEMHVDGGTTSQLFAYPLSVDMRELLNDIGIDDPPNLYIIRNAEMQPRWKTVKPRLTTIAARSIESLIRTQGVGDVYQVFMATVRDNINFYLASIPEDFNEVPEESFDPVYMRALFDRGYDMAQSGYPWKRFPPNFDPKTIGRSD